MGVGRLKVKWIFMPVLGWDVWFSRSHVCGCCKPASSHTVRGKSGRVLVTPNCTPCLSDMHSCWCSCFIMLSTSVTGPWVVQPSGRVCITAYYVAVPRLVNWESCGRKAIRHKVLRWDIGCSSSYLCDWQEQESPSTNQGPLKKPRIGMFFSGTGSPG